MNRSEVCARKPRRANKPISWLLDLPRHHIADCRILSCKRDDYHFCIAPILADQRQGHGPQQDAPAYAHARSVLATWRMSESADSHKKRRADFTAAALTRKGLEEKARLSLVGICS